MLRDSQFARLDDALIRLRRLWEGPLRRPARPDGSGTAELSTVLVAEAVSSAPRPGTATVADVATRLSIAPSTASRLVDRAVAAGVVHRGRSGSDARRAALTLTDAGVALAQEARWFRRRLLDTVLEGWADQDVTAFAELLDRFATAVHDRLPGPDPKESA